MRHMLVLVLLLLGGLQVLQASEYGSTGERHQEAAHSCCPGSGAHASCCPDACASPATVASPGAIPLFCGRMDRAAPPTAPAFFSRGENPLIRPPIL